jgi:tetratricopeptide (TPR) repeat protein
MVKKLLPIFLIVPLAMLFSSCLTGLLPGENGRILRNLAKEYYDIAQNYATANQYEKAIPYYELASRSREFQKSSQYQIARMNALASKWKEAENAYRTLLSLDRNNTDLQASLAYVLAQSIKLEEAEDLYRDLTEKNPYNEQLLENYIRVLVAEKKTDKAETELAHFAERFPQSTSNVPLTTLIEATTKKDAPLPEAETPATETEAT